jgi:hypothetical protein|tara:strand:- start:104 stop:250 length:147 start_codon:yes stop_codon:yes gene_type:complete
MYAIPCVLFFRGKQELIIAALPRIGAFDLPSSGLGLNTVKPLRYLFRD